MVPNPSDPQLLNRFSYTRNNPVKYIDPNGHMPTNGCSTEGCTDNQEDIINNYNATANQKYNQFYAKCAQGGGPECNTLHETENILKGAGVVLGGLAAPFVLLYLAASPTLASAAYGVASYTAGNGVVNRAQGKDFFEGWNPVDAALSAASGSLTSKLGFGPVRVGLVSAGQSAASQILQGKPPDAGQMLLNGVLGGASAKITGGMPALKSMVPQGIYGAVQHLGPITTDTALSVVGAAVSDLPRVVGQGISQAISDVQALVRSVFPPFGVNTYGR